MNMRQDTSFLFSGMQGKNNNSMGMNSFFSDYASIKNGSYGKLMKAYYTENKSDSVKSMGDKISKKVVSSQEEKVISKVQSSTDALKDSADALLAKGKDSVFESADAEKIYNAVSTFANNYNKVMEAVADSGTSSIVSRGQSMGNNTLVNSKALAKVGISVDANNKLSIDKDTFMKADMSKVENLFKGSGSFGYQVSAQASMLNFAADSAANQKNTYKANGQYFYNNSGNLFNSYF